MTEPSQPARPDDTSWDLGHPPARTRDEVVDRGWIDPSRADEALATYEGSGSRVSFASFLVERGLLTVQQIAELEAEGAAGERPTRPVEPGAVFSGCVIEAELGHGGMGTVYRARREADGDVVVVKFLAPLYVHNAAWRARFLREAVSARRVDDPRVVRVSAVEVEGDQPHIVMEHVAGQDLEERLAAEGPLPPDEVARLGRDLALGLAAAHAQGVIHRDVKPGNARLTPDGAVKILDFGLAKVVEADDGVSLAGQVLGTPFYMAPEQWGEHMVDERSDVYGLGATLYHLLTGRVPYPGDKPMSVQRRVLSGRCPRPSTLREGVPEPLELAILRMMAVDRRARYGSAAACAEALQAVLDGEPTAVASLVEVASGARHPLLPAAVHVVGRSAEADVGLHDLAASRTHARVRFGSTGYQLTDLGSSGGTFVNGAAVESVHLRPGDVIRCGHTELRFEDDEAAGPAAAPAPEPGGRLQVTTLPEPFLAALVAEQDRRVVVALLERLPLEPLESRVASTRRALAGLYDDGLAEAAGDRLRSRLLGLRRAAGEALFRITFEDLGDDCEAWLGWWSEAGSGYPPQLGPQRLRPRIRLRVLAGAPEAAYELTERLRTTIGRGPECDLQLATRSLSRRHATVLRLHEHLMIRDDGSRYGSRVNDAPVASAFLEPGDRVTLGRVTLTCEAQDLVAQPPRTPKGLHLVEPDLFEALCDLRHPSVAAALDRFRAFAGDLDWVDRQAARLYDRPDRVRAAADRVKAAYAAQARRAEELRPSLSPEGVPQVLPVGWFQPSA